MDKIAKLTFGVWTIFAIVFFVLVPAYLPLTLHLFHNLRNLRWIVFCGPLACAYALAVLLLSGHSAFAQQTETIHPLPLTVQPSPVAGHDMLRPFEITQPDSLQRGLLKRSANSGLDWYFSSLALVLAPEQSLVKHAAHFEAALRQVAIPGPMPINPSPGLRRISVTGQLWELQATVPWGLFWNCAIEDFPSGAPVDWHHLDDCGRIWRNWGRVQPDAFWSLLDTTDDLLAVRAPDSHDSQAAVFLMALARWVNVTGSWDWLEHTLWRVPARDGHPPEAIKRITIMREMVRHNLLNHMQDGLFRTFRHNRHPQGGQWDVQYLMDNIECQAALRALIPLFERAGETAFASVLRHYDSELSVALASLISTQPAAPGDYRKWARQGDWPKIDQDEGRLVSVPNPPVSATDRIQPPATVVDQPVAGSGSRELQNPAIASTAPVAFVPLDFYPHVASQYWEGLFNRTDWQPDVGIATAELSRRWTALEPHLGTFSDWWRQADLHLSAGLPPYWARMRNTPGGASDVSPNLLTYSKQLRPDNCVISDYVVAQRIITLLEVR